MVTALIIDAPTRPVRVPPNVAFISAHVESIVPESTEQLLRRLDLLPAGSADRARLRTRVIEENLAMTRRLAQRYSGRGELIDDLTQVAAMALVKAVDGYDSGRNSLFVSYAVASIVGALKRHFRDTAWGVHVPRGTQELVLLVRATSGELTHRLGRSPTSTELAGHLDVGVDRLLDAQVAVHAYRPASLDMPPPRVDGSSETSLIQALGKPDPGYTAVNNRLTVLALIAVLPERARRIVTMSFYDEMTQSQIAEVVGVSQMQVSRLLRQSLDRLRVVMAPPATGLATTHPATPTDAADRPDRPVTLAVRLSSVDISGPSAAYGRRAAHNAVRRV